MVHFLTIYQDKIKDVDPIPTPVKMSLFPESVIWTAVVLAALINPPVAVDIPVTETPAPVADAESGVITDEALAASYRSQADRLFKEAKSLREQAEALVPTKKKTTAKAKQEVASA